MLLSLQDTNLLFKTCRERRNLVMENKAKKAIAKTEAHAKSTHSSHKKKAEKKASSNTGATLVNTLPASGASNSPAAGVGEDMAVLSETQQARVFDMSMTDDPAGNRAAVEDARTQAALQPVGTSAALEPITTEDGVITR
jgi:hypothetical protein